MAPTKFIGKLLEGPLNIDPSKAGKTLLGLNAVGMAAAAATDTFAAAVDKNTKPEDKKFLIPAGVATGVAKLGIYYTMTTAIIDKLQGKEKFDKDGHVVKKIKGFADHVLEKMDDKTFNSNVKNYVEKNIKKAETGLFGTGLFKKSAQYVADMKNTLKDAEGNVTNAAKTLFKSNVKSGFGVLGSFIGAAVGSAILTPIIRDVSAYFVQKHMEKKKPEATREDIEPFLNIVGARNLAQRQPISMKSYMAQTKSGMKI